MIYLGLIFVAAFGISIFRAWRFRSAIRKRARGEMTADESVKCLCGYELTNLEIPRCPECGRVFHFDATMQDLGLTEEELIEAGMRRRARESERPKE